MDKLNVAVITEIPVPYRSPVFAMISEIEDVRLKVFYCSASEYGRDWKLERNRGYDYEVLPGRSLTFKGANVFSFKINPSVWKRLNEGEFDLVILGGYTHFTMLLGILWCRLKDIPYVIMSESQFLKHRGFLKKFIKKLVVKPIVSGTFATMPVGTLAREYLISYGADPERSFIFPNTPDVDYFSEECGKYKGLVPKIREETGIETPYVILYVGRFLRVKGVQYIMSAFRILQQEMGVDDVTLLMIGDGDLKEELTGYVERHQITNVVFRGFVQHKELPRMYALADVFILPSLREQWGVVVNEALACGLPLVVTRTVGSAHDLVREGENGYRVKEADPEDMARAIGKIVGDDNLRRSMSRVSLDIIRDWKYDKGIESFNRICYLVRKSDVGNNI